MQVLGCGSSNLCLGESNYGPGRRVRSADFVLVHVCVCARSCT